MDMHRFQQQFQTSKTRLWKTSLAEEDKESIELFLRDRKARGTGYARLTKLCQVLTHLGGLLGKSFHKAHENDIKDLVRHYEEGDYSKWVRHDIKVVLKQYYAWMNKGIYPKQVAWICTTIPLHEKRILYEGEILTQDEINKVIDSCDHPRNKALIAVFAESGARVAEIGEMLIRQITIDPNGAVLNVEGKTGSRRLRLVTATPHLVNWLNNHPDKNNPYAPVWVNVGAQRYHEGMSYEGIRKIIKLAFQKADIKKRCNPYIFRHTRACQLAHHLTEFQMNAYFGWVQGSEMPGLYVHISGKDLDEHLLRINGMKPGEKPIAFKPQARACPRCREINSPSALYCCKCAEIVDPALALKVKLEDAQKPVDTAKSPFSEWLQNDPELRELLKRKANEFKERTLI
jgi:integrase/recombinase XerD